MSPPTISIGRGSLVFANLYGVACIKILAKYREIYVSIRATKMADHSNCSYCNMLNYGTHHFYELVSFEWCW